MLVVDKSAVNAAIETMGTMFDETKKVLAEYEAEKQVLVKREEGFNKRISEIREEHASAMIDREVAKDSTSDYIYLSGKMKQLDDEMNIILDLEDQLKADFKQLKQKYILVIRDTYSKDLSAKNQFDVNHAVDLMLYELLKSISDFASEVQKQQRPLMEIVREEFLDDTTLMEENRSFKRAFDFDSTYLSYSGDPGNTVLAKNHIHYAVGGSLHPDIRQPVAKEVK